VVVGEMLNRVIGQHSLLDPPDTNLGYIARASLSVAIKMRRAMSVQFRQALGLLSHLQL
jgi:hypothetical protein